mmetsp:Transcript_76499/g.147709  ORF Transcript_76499/g.147709 Transcript_76499/m.147709 type:complete len:117 (-) Transcript_76499:71-421(-)
MQHQAFKTTVMRLSVMEYSFQMPSITKIIKINRSTPAVPVPINHTANVQMIAESAVKIMPVPKRSRGASFFDHLVSQNARTTESNVTLEGIQAAAKERCPPRAWLDAQHCGFRSHV